MLYVSGNENSYCPYRDCLGINAPDGRISWYQLLCVSQAASPTEIEHRYRRRRMLVAKNRQSTFHPVWDQLLDELDRAFMTLTDTVRKAEYDEDLLRRNRQSAQYRLPARDAEDWQAAMHTAKIRSARRPPASLPQPTAGPRELYEPLRCIGDGPQGTRVYEAWEHALNRRVAVRCLLRSARTKRRVQSFLEEARFLASVSHPHLAEVHTVSERGFFVVMEYLEETLVAHRKACRHGQCSPEFVFRFLRESLSILDRLHRSGVVHGAIGQRSFHLTESGVIKLVDAPGCTSAGIFRAPRPDQTCLAPELLSPETFGEPGAATDLYMLGFTAFELLAGDQIQRWLPKLGTGEVFDQQQWLQWHASHLEQLPALESLIAGLPPRLAEVIEKLCEKQVVERCGSAAAALQLLDGQQTESQSDEPQMPVAGETSATARGTVTRKSARSAPTTRKVGGESPLVCEALRNNAQQPDLLETLQDPRLLWNRLKTDQRLRIACGGMAAVLVACVALSGDGTAAGPPATVHTPDERLALNEQPAGYPDAIPMWTPELPPEPEMPEPPVVATAPRPVATEPDVGDLEPAAAILDLPVQLPTPTDVSAPVADAAPLAIEDIPAFRARGLDRTKCASLQDILQRLRMESAPGTKRTLYRDAQQLAPGDPRVHFIYAAACRFSPDSREVLETAVKLSPPEYTQPFRQLLQLRLMAPGNRQSIADEILAKLWTFADQVHELPAGPAREFEWQWTGRMLGCLTREAAGDPEIAGMLREQIPRILDQAGSQGAVEIQKGLRTVVALDESITARGVFPLQAEMACSLCLKSLIPDDTLSVAVTEPGNNAQATSASAERGASRFFPTTADR